MQPYGCISRTTVRKGNSSGRSDSKKTKETVAFGGWVLLLQVQRPSTEVDDAVMLAQDFGTEQPGHRR
jgi:hypothetical protein